MSLSVRRRKSRRKLQHQPKNLEDVLFSPNVTAPFSGNVRKEVDDNSSRHLKNEDSHGENRCNRSERRASDHHSSPCSSGSSFSTTPFSSVRRCEENDLDLESISFRLGQRTYELDEMGNWSSSSKSCLNLEETNAQINDRNKSLAQENNMLRVKNELLADMIARKNLRKEKITKELERLRKLLSTSSSRFSVNVSTNKK